MQQHPRQAQQQRGPGPPVATSGAANSSKTNNNNNNNNNNNGSLTPTRKTRRGKRGGRGRSLSPRLGTHGGASEVGGRVAGAAYHPSAGDWVPTHQRDVHGLPQRRTSSPPSSLMCQQQQDEMVEATPPPATALSAAATAAAAAASAAAIPGAAWGHQEMYGRSNEMHDMVADPVSISWIDTSRSYYQASFAFGHNYSTMAAHHPGRREARAGVGGIGYGTTRPRSLNSPVAATASVRRPREPPALLIRRVQGLLHEMACFFAHFSDRQMSLPVVDMKKVEVQLGGASALMLELQQGLAETYSSMPAAQPCVAPSVLPRDVEQQQQQQQHKAYARTDMTGTHARPAWTVEPGELFANGHRVGMGWRGMNDEPRTQVVGGNSEWQAGMGVARGVGGCGDVEVLQRGEPSPRGRPPVYEEGPLMAAHPPSRCANVADVAAPARPGSHLPLEIEVSEHLKNQVEDVATPPAAAGPLAANGTLSSTDNESEMVGGEGVAVKKKKRRGKRGVRKGKKQMEGFAGFPLAPGLGPEFAGQPRRRLPKAPSLEIMRGEHDLSEYCLQDESGSQTGSDATPKIAPDGAGRTIDNGQEDVLPAPGHTRSAVVDDGSGNGYASVADERGVSAQRNNQEDGDDRNDGYDGDNCDEYDTLGDNEAEDVYTDLDPASVDVQEQRQFAASRQQSGDPSGWGHIVTADPNRPFGDKREFHHGGYYAHPQCSPQDSENDARKSNISSAIPGGQAVVVAGGERGSGEGEGAALCHSNRGLPTPGSTSSGRLGNTPLTNPSETPATTKYAGSSSVFFPETGARPSEDGGKGSGSGGVIGAKTDCGRTESYTSPTTPMTAQVSPTEHFGGDISGSGRGSSGVSENILTPAKSVVASSPSTETEQQQQLSEGVHIDSMKDAVGVRDESTPLRSDGATPSNIDVHAASTDDTGSTAGNFQPPTWPQQQQQQQQRQPRPHHLRVRSEVSTTGLFGGVPKRRSPSAADVGNAYPSAGTPRHWGSWAASCLPREPSSGTPTPEGSGAVGPGEREPPRARNGNGSRHNLEGSRLISPPRYRATVADVQEAFERADTRVAKGQEQGLFGEGCSGDGGGPKRAQPQEGDGAGDSSGGIQSTSKLVVQDANPPRGAPPPSNVVDSSGARATCRGSRDEDDEFQKTFRQPWNRESDSSVEAPGLPSSTPRYRRPSGSSTGRTTSPPFTAMQVLQRQAEHLLNPNQERPQQQCNQGQDPESFCGGIGAGSEPLPAPAGEAGAVESDGQAGVRCRLDGRSDQGAFVDEAVEVVVRAPDL
ncbi:unnamed protein product [Ectocarpus sp. 12 AP-2014]